MTENMRGMKDKMMLHHTIQRKARVKEDSTNITANEMVKSKAESTFPHLSHPCSWPAENLLILTNTAVEGFSGPL